MPLATATSPRWTQNGSISGHGAYSASSPESSGPQPRPPMFAAVAANPARAFLPGGASSMTAAVAAPLSRPAAPPDSSRPAKSRGRPLCRRKHPALAADKAMAHRSTGLRPTSSE